MQGKGDKKISVVSKTPSQKKPNLEVKIPQDHDQGAKTAPGSFSTFAKEAISPNKAANISQVTSPTHLKSTHPMP